MATQSPHSFHIPVMGLAYTIDSPVKVARFGISSVVSIMEDNLVEMMRRYYYPLAAKTYFPIPATEPGYRAKRITDYLNLLNDLVNEQVEKLTKAAFETGSEIIQYFEMLPEDSKLKLLYREVMQCTDAELKHSGEEYLRQQIVAGRIDVNIMTKVDGNHYNSHGEPLEDGSDAVTALLGYASSNLTNSSIIFSAGMNPRLYNYLEKLPQFDANDNGLFQKKIVIKVSDYRSALIQGKYLAKKGIWVSEFRIESGLNCGGHAFATDGFLMGPILEEFKQKKEELASSIFQLYNSAIQAKGHKGFDTIHPLKITAQGGIGTYEEDSFLHNYYRVESTGWGTPFLLVPEATTVDSATLSLLCKAEKDDLLLSNNSPLGVRFHYLKGTSADIEKKARIGNGRPGSPCTEKLLATNTEFTEKPICTASVKYQQLKIASLQAQHLPVAAYLQQLTALLDKECLCIGLSNAAAKVYNLPFINKLQSVNICPGPNIAYFNKIVSLQTMVDHIYGRTNIMASKQRPHMFIAELGLYIQHLQEQLEADNGVEPTAKKKKYYAEFYANLLQGIEYYRQLPGAAAGGRKAFLEALDAAENTLAKMQAFISEELVSHM